MAEAQSEVKPAEANPDQNAAIRSSSRERRPTEKGFEYERVTVERNFKLSVSRWRALVNRLTVLLSDSDEIGPIRDARFNLETEFSRVSASYARLSEMTELGESTTGFFALFEEIERDHQTIMCKVSDRILEFRSFQSDSQGNTSERSRSTRTKQSKRSKSSIASKNSDAIAEVAALKTKLKFIDAEGKAKMELDRVVTQRKIEAAQAKINALDDALSQSLSDPEDNIASKLPEVNKQEFVRAFIEQSQPASHTSDENANDTPTTIQQSTGILELTKSLSEQLSLSRLPPPEPGVFDGDPLKYPGWKSAFQTLIERKSIPSSEKVYYLRKYLCQEVRDVVSNFFLIDSDDAYDEARKLLDERYGDPFRVASAFRDKLDSWPKVNPKDAMCLLKFADFLKQCLTAMRNIPCLEVLNDCRENRKLLAKLPDWLVNRWNRVVVSEKESSQTFPSFKTFTDFVYKEAKIASDPVTSLQSLKSESYPVKPKRFEGGSFASATNSHGSALSDRIPTCPLCQATHDLDLCDIYLKKSLDQRKAFARDRQLCFGCLGDGHISKMCKQRKQCKICTKLHPTSLHGSTIQNVKDFRSPDTSKIAQTPHSASSFLSGHGAHCKTTMIIPVYVSHHDDPGTERLVYAMLDTQSDTTFVQSGTCNALGITGVPASLVLSTMHAKNEPIQSQRIRGLSIRGFNSTTRIPLPDAFVRDTIPGNKGHIPTPEIARLWPHLNPIADHLMPVMQCEFGLLIGYNCPRALMPREVIPPAGNGPYGQRTDLGWGIVGLTNPNQTQEDPTDAIGVSHNICILEVPTDVATDATDHDAVTFSFPATIKVATPPDVVQMLELDFVDRNVSGASISQEDKRFISLMRDGIQLKNGHYTMPLPFKTNFPSLPDNKEVAARRLSSLRKRLKSCSEYHSHYEAFMTNLIESGHAEKVPDSELSLSTDHCWYIPHHGVYHPKKPGKLRVVFDCSATFKGESLNKHLLQGPDLTNKLIGVLCRFRKERVAFVCDIEQMFHQFVVESSHRDYLRFLWWSDTELNHPETYRMCVHLFGATSSPACANFGLKQVASDNELEFGPEVANFLRNDFYVDDGLKSVSTATEAIDMIDRSKDLCQRGGLRLHKFASNSKEVLQSIPKADRAKGLTTVDIFTESLPMERALGAQWCIESDSFQFRIELSDKPLTRRGILSTVSSIYDPLGLISPVILRGKQILQQLCAENIDWDDPVSEHISMLWQNWRTDLQHLSTLQVSRCLKPDDFGEPAVVQFHHFSDASTTGYGQCSYIKQIDHTGKAHCSLLMGKSRVAPLKAMTIPRLELTAATVSVKISQLLQKELPYANATHFFWTDSRVVLGYICNDSKRFHIFVANRVQQIRDFSTPSQWRYVETNHNVADIASRGATAKELISSDWFTGPKFLWEQDIMPLLDTPEASALNSDDPEVKVQCFQTQIERDVSSSILERLEYFSTWDRAKKAIALCLRYKQILRHRVAERHKGSSESLDNPQLHPGQLSVEELIQAEREIIRHVQTDSFSNEVKLLQREDSQKRNLPKNSSLYRLDPILDMYGLVRVGGRMRNSSLCYDSVHSVILPKKGHITSLIIQHCHAKVQHQGRGMTINHLRENDYWIIGCTSLVSNLIYHCTVCRKLRGRLQEQKMADLPSDRVNPAPPFSYCGVDIFGPFYIREGRKDLKRYGVLFTCLASRAIHIETANSLCTHSFINALRRFLSLRGPIRQLRSDRGTNFVGAERELREAVSEMDVDQVSAYLIREGCDNFIFKQNVPSASHMGGVWERQIRTVRSILSNLLRGCGSQLDDESLRTFLCEITAIVNSRPLSVENLNDPLSSAPLTPNHLLTMKSKVLLPPPGKFVKADLYTRQRWKRIQFLANEFWGRWRSEYLSNLQCRSKWNTTRRNIKVGDVVMIKDDNLPRNKWRIALVTKADPGLDGRVRKVSLKTPAITSECSGKDTNNMIVLERPIHKLVLLMEVDS